MYIIMNEEIIRKIIDRYFQDNKTALVQHHIDSYNDFFSNGIYSIFKEKNPIRINKLVLKLNPILLKINS